ncbi:hypothetical protein ACSMXN_08800 [Jatrophihabitans sp. DSM 45814]
MRTHRYRICVAGRLGPAAQEGFEGLDVAPKDGVTELSGSLDQAGLYGVLKRIESLALELVEVRREH